MMTDSIVCSSLLRELKRLSLRLLEIVKRDFSLFTMAQFNWKSSQDSWSIGQCLSHLNAYLGEYLPYISKVIETKATPKATVSYSPSFYGQYLVQKVSLQTNNKVKSNCETRRKFMPTIQLVNGHEELTFFLEKQSLLLQFIQKVETISLGKITVPLSFWGFSRLKLGDLLQLLVYHTERHIIQAQRIYYHDAFLT